MPLTKYIPDIRRMAPGDEALLTLIAAKFRGEKVSATRAKELLATASSILFVAMDQDKPIGWIVGYVIERFKGKELFIYEVDVSERFRRRGIGRALVHKMLEFGESESMKEAFVLTTQSNSAAMALYRICGMKRANSDDALFTCKYKN